MRDPAQAALYRHKFFVLACRVYIVLGLISLGAGVYLGTRPMLPEVRHSREGVGLLLIAFILIAFGLIRIVNAISQLRRVASQRFPASPVSEGGEPGP